MGPLFEVPGGSPTLLGPRSEILMIFGGFSTSFGEPWAPIFDTFRAWFSAYFWRRFQDHRFSDFGSILGAIWESFSSLFGDPWI